MTTRHLVRAAAVTLGTAAGSYLFWSAAARAVDHPDLFVLTSPDFADNGHARRRQCLDRQELARSLGVWRQEHLACARLDRRAGRDPGSFAVLMDDPDAASGRGGNHWITYEIPRVGQRRRAR